MFRTLKKLVLGRPSVSGDESRIAAVIAAEMQPFCDSVTRDATGNLICLKKGSGENPRRIMLTAHMDEIGFLVTKIEENGYLRIAPVGGVDMTAAAYSEVVFAGGTRGVLVPVANAPEKEKLTAEHMVVDIGADSARNAARRVKIGDTLALMPHLCRMTGKKVYGRPIDDRIGCAILIELAQTLCPADDIYYVFTAQEEVGIGCAAPAAFAVAPDLALNLDVTSTGDEQGAKPMAVALGKGVAIKVKDASVICDRGLVEELAELAELKNIPIQYEILLAGGTDTAVVQMARGGCRAGALSIPCRYVHTGVELFDMADAECALALLRAYLGGEEK